MNLSKQELYSKYGVVCNWENKEECTYQSECINFGRCIYLQECEDRCL